MKYLWLALLITSCGYSPTLNIDTTFKSYYDSFITLVGDQYERDLSISFVDSLPGKVGHCDSYHKIEVVKSPWNRMSIDERRVLMYHELSHCLLNLGHSDDSTNYMYHQSIELPEGTLNKQVKDYLK